jgi:hypothetical protein
MLSAYAEDQGLWPWMNAKRITLRSLVCRKVCFGGFRRRTWSYHELRSWGSIGETNCLVRERVLLDIEQRRGYNQGNLVVKSPF